MPPKIKKLKALLSQVGFIRRPAKESHTMWVHPRLPEMPVVISGKDGDDAENIKLEMLRKH